MREVPIERNEHALRFAAALLSGRFDMMIFLTGVGTRALTKVVETRYRREEFVEALTKIKVVARGPKPVAALKELRVSIDVKVPEPNTWRELLQAIAPVRAGLRVAVQEYGKPNLALIQGLRDRRAHVTPVPVYQWELPEDTGPLRQAIRDMTEGRADVVLFTTSVQVPHLFTIAAEMQVEDRLRTALVHVMVASIGPICSESLDPTPFRMGSLRTVGARSLGKTVLVAEADGRELASTSSTLRNAGYYVLDTLSLDQARWLLSEHRPDLLVADIGLGRDNGLQLVWARHHATPGAPTIVTHRYDDPSRALEARRLGAVYLSSPVKPAVLLRRVELMIGSGRHTVEEERSTPRIELRARVEAVMGGRPGAVIDVSDGGCRLRFSLGADAPLHQTQRLQIPTQKLDLDASPVWKRTTYDGDVYGLVVSADQRSSQEWRGFVTSVERSGHSPAAIYRP